MQMIRPLFGSLRRRQRAALWFQYRSSLRLSVVQMHVYRMQLDDQRINSTVPCVFYVSPNSNEHPALEASVLKFIRKKINLNFAPFFGRQIQKNVYRLRFYGDMV